MNDASSPHPLWGAKRPASVTRLYASSGGPSGPHRLRAATSALSSPYGTSVGPRQASHRFPIWNLQFATAERLDTIQPSLECRSRQHVYL